MNNFNGVLPASDDWTSLSIYLASDNAFSGAIPRNVYRAPFLTWLDVSYNGWACLLVFSQFSVRLSHYKDSSHVLRKRFFDGWM
jgi:hypothetical protein